PPPPTTTYTSIPLPTGDVISRSIHNLTSAISSHRPWSELVFSGDFSLPESFSSLLLRSKTNFNYSFVNYTIVVATCAAFALITASPVALIVVGVIIALSLWLLFHFFREDPLILWSFQVGDRTVVLFLVLASVWAIWFTSSAVNLAVGVSVGLLLCIIHSVLKNSDELFLEEDDAVTGGLIGSNLR
ncbi:Prenylated rab acceptor PRA1, partial [Arabidopsis thaliana x Arabidopsis arenosa]